MNGGGGGSGGRVKLFYFSWFDSSKYPLTDETSLKIKVKSGGGLSADNLG